MTAAPELAPPFRLIAYEQIGSTNDEAKRLAEAGADHGTVVWAAEQTAGRGRRGRYWHSPRGNLHSSFLLFPRCPLHEAAQLGFVTAVALREALREICPVGRFECKWPNDVLCHGLKVAGILLETAGQADWMVVGVGVNVVAAPDPALYPATCLRGVGCPATAGEVLAALCRNFGVWYDTWRQQGFPPVREAWLAGACGLGRPAEARLADGEVVRGIFAGLDAGGALLLTSADGGQRSVLAGDVFFAGGR